MKRLTWITIAAGAAAAYMMYRRGESLPVIAKRSILNPFGSVVAEIKQAL